MFHAKEDFSPPTRHPHPPLWGAEASLPMLDQNNKFLDSYDG